jgi:hypothetical protein
LEQCLALTGSGKAGLVHPIRTPRHQNHRQPDSRGAKTCAIAPAAWPHLPQSAATRPAWLGSQRRPSLFKDPHAAALPTTAPFFFESETAGLMFVRHRWPQRFRWWFFSWFPREDAAADHYCGHGCNEKSKLY